MAENPNNKGAKITIYWLDQSRAHRIVWLLEELKLDYDLKIYKRNKEMRAPKELEDIHPLGKSPVIGVKAPSGDKEIIIAESGPIVEYLMDHFGTALVPARYPAGQEGVPGTETEEWVRFRYYMHYAEGSIMAPLLIGLVFSQIKGPAVPFFVRPLTRAIAGQVESTFLNPELKKHWTFLESQVSSSGGDYLCGSKLTGADILMIFPIDSAIQGGALDKTKYPKLVEYAERLKARPAYKAAVEKVEKETGEKFKVVPGVD